MERRQQDQRFLAQQRPVKRLGQRERRVLAHGRVQCALLYGLVQLVRGAGLQKHLDLGALGDKARQDVGQQAVQSGVDGAYGQLAHQAFRVHMGLGVGQLAQQLGHGRGQAVAGRRGCDRAPGPSQQRRAELALQRAHLLRHGRGGEVDAARGLGQGAGLDHQKKAAQVLGFHHHIISCF
ncbi:hypothetical protein D3C78_1029670 [compost metagenome]